MKYSNDRKLAARTNRLRSHGFTLIEVLVALALFTVLMVVVFVPLTQAARFLSVGKTRTGLQQAANQTVTQLQRDLQRAIYVYPNDNLPGITDALPYSSTPVSIAPYFRGTVRDDTTGNTSRIDMLLPELDVNGNAKYPVTPAKYIVTYYARRLDATKDYDVYSNPIVLFRAQYPYVNPDGTSLSVAVDTSSARYSGSPAWLTQSNTAANRGEFDLEPYCQDATAGGLISGNHILATPRNVALVSPNATPSTLPARYNLIPTTSFTCADTNSDGKIDQVTVNLTLTQFDRQVTNGGNDSTQSVGSNLNFQKFSLAQTINLPNVR